MKRGHQNILQEKDANCSLTPRGGGLARKAPTGSVLRETRDKRSKGHHQPTLFAFWADPAALADDTPAVSGVNGAKTRGIAPPTTGFQRQLGKLGIHTPAVPVDEGTSSGVFAVPSIIRGPSQPTQAPQASTDAEPSVNPCSHRKGSRGEGDDDFGFSISMSQSYTRHTQAATDEEEKDDGEDLFTYSQQQPYAGSFSAAGYGGGAAFGSQLCGSLQPSAPAAPRSTLKVEVNALEGQGSSKPGEEAEPSPLGAQQPEVVTIDDEFQFPLGSQGPVASGGPAITPELHVGAGSADLHDDGCTMHITPRDENCVHVPNMFQPRSQRQKILVIVRHGESTYNAACTTNKWDDPDHIFDAALTQQGISQARSLQSKLRDILEKYKAFGDPLWVTSPLSRAIQTFLYMCPFPDKLEQGQLNVAVTAMHSEFLKTTGDVGRPASILQQEFPELAEQLGALPETWWYQDTDKENCALARVHKSKEDRKSLENRVMRFKGWLRQREERLIVAVGHACFWRAFVGPSTNVYMKNCEVQVLKDW